ncbi:unnamed protein product [Anisakis simplex]|uniref:Synapse differentiation-inducing gene protein 1-like n=1 Tax=Anisakis simplex TaxID=6269 RepID=A0A0M3JDV8_ANISI|nr:unnamed protein product [Anisakis simplex]
MPQHHYRTYCYSNDTDDTPRFEFFKDEDNKQAIVKFFGLIPLPLALISLVLAVCYAICLCGAIKGKHGNAKYDALILNRTVGDILCCVSALVTSLYVINTMHIK